MVSTSGWQERFSTWPIPASNPVEEGANIASQLLVADVQLMTKTVAACLVLLLLAACSSGTQTGSDTESHLPAKPAVKQAEYETGRTALQKVYVSARGWAGDVQLFRLQSQFMPEAPSSEGKAGLWRGSFASPSRRMMKQFVWSGLVGNDAPEQGVSFSAEDSWNPGNSSTRIFELGFLKVDSDKAYEVAQKHGGEKLTAKDPGQPVLFVLDWDTQKNELVWHVIYGSTGDEAKLRVAVNGTSGEFLRVER